MNFSVFISNTTLIDRNVWKAFLSGHSVASATLKLYPNPNPNQDPINFIITQFRNFEMLENFLTHPKTLSTQLIFSLSAATRSNLISSYYRIDSRICRELLGKKLTHRIRKDLDDIAQKTRRSILLCRRVFDNMKRITKRVEDSEGNMVVFIQNHFLLSKELACKYAHLIFINHYRLDTYKRRLANFSYAEYDYGASVILSYFTASPDSALEELDPLLVDESRLLKIAIFNHKDVLERLRTTLIQHVETLKVDQDTTALVTNATLAEKITPGSFKVIMRNIMTIGASLSNSKEIRDIFLNILERVVDPCLSFGWDVAQVEFFFDSLIYVFLHYGADLNSPSISKYSNSFSRLFTGVKLITLRFMSASIQT